MVLAACYGMPVDIQNDVTVETVNEMNEAIPGLKVTLTNNGLRIFEDFTDEIIDLYHALKKEKESFGEMGIDFEEKAFYDILLSLAVKYDFEYPDDKLIVLAQAVKTVVDDKTKYTDWSKRADIKAELKVDLIILLAEHDYPPVDRDEVYKEIFEQAENFKKYQN